jgi:transposase InsO family protein
LKTNVENVKDQRSKDQNEISGWIIDSAATNHITNDINDLVDFESLNETLQWGTNSECDVKGQGIVKFGCSVGQIKNWVSLGKTLYAPDFKYKLFSTSSAAAKGWRFLNTKNAITATLNHKVNFIATRELNGFYYGDFEVENNIEERRKAIIKRLNVLYDNFKQGKTNTTLNEREQQRDTNNQTCITSTESDRLRLWHRRLGHTNYEKIKEMKEKEIVYGLGPHNFKLNGKIDCECCQIMKPTRLKFDKGPRERAEGLLDLVHTDVCGPIREQTLGGASYIVTFIDDASRKSEVYTIRNKSEVFEVFKDYKLRVEKETERNIKILRSDNGGEYCSNEFEEYLRSKGIKHENTTVYTPQQNGVAERLNRSLLETARCLLREGGVPNMFWPEAVKMANTIRNRITTKICGDKTPYELWTGRKPNIAYFKVFGCTAYVRIPRPNWQSKLDQRAERGIFLGYDDRRKASIIWIQDDQRMVHSRDVRFIENECGWREVNEIDDQQASVSIQMPYTREEENDKNSNRTSIESTEMDATDNFENVIQQGKDNIQDGNDSTRIISLIESSSEEETGNDTADRPGTSRYDFRERTLKVKPTKYSMVTENSDQKPRRASTLEELMKEYGPKWNDDR